MESWCEYFTTGAWMGLLAKNSPKLTELAVRVGSVNMALNVASAGQRKADSHS